MDGHRCRHRSRGERPQARDRRERQPRSSLLDAESEPLFEEIQLGLGELDLSDGGLRTVPEVVRPPPEAGGARVLLGDPHRVAV